MATYRSWNTGLVFTHPRSGIGPSLHSDEIEETGHKVADSKPRVKLGSSKTETAAARKRQKPQGSATKSEAPKTTGNSAGDSEQEGA